MEKYMEDREALEMKYLDLCKPLYEERGNVFSGRLYDKIERIHKEGGGEKEEEGSKGDTNAGGGGGGGAIRRSKTETTMKMTTAKRTGWTFYPP